MKNFYRTSDGDILPFHSVIRVTYKPTGRPVTRVYFVNGCIDLSNETDGDFYGWYEEWLQKQK